MIVISHRGNLRGPDPLTENTEAAIDAALRKGFAVEVDVWADESGWLWLGHDAPCHPVELSYLKARADRLYVHCKDSRAAAVLGRSFNAFGHDADGFVITSRGDVWVYPGKPLPPMGGIAVMPERTNIPWADLLRCDAICTDYPEDCQEALMSP